MADLVAIGYPDETTVAAAVDEAYLLARDLVKLGTSALFLMLEKATPDRVVEVMSKFVGTVLKIPLSKQDEQEPQDALRGGTSGHSAGMSPHDGRLPYRELAQVQGSRRVNR